MSTRASRYEAVSRVRKYLVVDSNSPLEILNTVTLPHITTGSRAWKTYTARDLLLVREDKLAEFRTRIEEAKPIGPPEYWIE